MMRDLTDEQAMCLHILHTLAIEFTLPSQRVTGLQIIRDHLGCLGSERFAGLRGPVNAMLDHQTHLQWSFATMDLCRALAALHKAEACQRIAALAAKRVA